MVFPWQIQQWLQLWEAKAGNRLPHALLLTGPAGTGKSVFAESFMLAQGCQHVLNKPDNDETISLNCPCRHCRLITGKTHPNVLWITPEKTGAAIKIDQIREVNEFTQQTSLQEGLRFVIIHPAHHMNLHASNALFKTLEEPAPGAVMILISDQISHLPAAILSRCHSIRFPKPPKELALSWLASQLSNPVVEPELLLKMAQGSPLTALQLAQSDRLRDRMNLMQALQDVHLSTINPVQSAAAFQSLELLFIIDLTMNCGMDLLKLKFNCREIMNEDFTSQLMKLTQKTSGKHLIKFLDYLQTLRGQVISGINLNKQLAVENIFIRWYQLYY